MGPQTIKSRPRTQGPEVSSDGLLNDSLGVTEGNEEKEGEVTGGGALVVDEQIRARY